MGLFDHIQPDAAPIDELVDKPNVGGTIDTSRVKSITELLEEDVDVSVEDEATLGAVLKETAKGTARAAARFVEGVLGQYDWTEEGGIPPIQVLDAEGNVIEEVQLTPLVEGPTPGRMAAKAVAESEFLKENKAVMQDMSFGDQLLYAAPNVGISVALSALTRNPTTGAAYMGTQIMGSKIESLVEDGVDLRTATKMGFTDAIMQMPLERLGISAMTKHWKLKTAIAKRLKNMVEAAITEGTTEAIQVLPDNITDILGRDTSKSELEAAWQMLSDPNTYRQMGIEGSMGAIFGFGFGAGGNIKSQTLEEAATQSTEKDLQEVIVPNEEVEQQFQTFDEAIKAEEELTDVQKKRIERKKVAAAKRQEKAKVQEKPKKVTKPAKPRVPEPTKKPDKEFTIEEVEQDIKDFDKLIEKQTNEDVKKGLQETRKLMTGELDKLKKRAKEAKEILEPDKEDLAAEEKAIKKVTEEPKPKPKKKEKPAKPVPWSKRDKLEAEIDGEVVGEATHAAVSPSKATKAQREQLADAIAKLKKKHPDAKIGWRNKEGKLYTLEQSAEDVQAKIEQTEEKKLEDRKKIKVPEKKAEVKAPEVADLTKAQKAKVQRFRKAVKNAARRVTLSEPGLREDVESDLTIALIEFVRKPENKGKGFKADQLALNAINKLKRRGIGSRRQKGDPTVQLDEAKQQLETGIAVSEEIRTEEEKIETAAKDLGVVEVDMGKPVEAVAKIQDAAKKAKGKEKNALQILADRAAATLPEDALIDTSKAKSKAQKQALLKKAIAKRERELAKQAAQEKPVGKVPVLSMETLKGKGITIGTGVRKKDILPAGTRAGKGGAIFAKRESIAGEGGEFDPEVVALKSGAKGISEVEGTTKGKSFLSERTAQNALDQRKKEGRYAGKEAKVITRSVPLKGKGKKTKDTYWIEVTPVAKGVQPTTIGQIPGTKAKIRKTATQAVKDINRARREAAEARAERERKILKRKQEVTSKKELEKQRAEQRKAEEARKREDEFPGRVGIIPGSQPYPKFKKITAQPLHPIGQKAKVIINKVSPNTDLVIFRNIKEIPPNITGALKQRGQDITKMKGAYSKKTNTIYLVANKFKNQSEAAKTAIHELVHNKVKEHSKKFKDVFESNEAAIRAVAKDQGIKQAGKAVDEWLAQELTQDIIKAKGKISFSKKITEGIENRIARVQAADVITDLNKIVKEFGYTWKQSKQKDKFTMTDDTGTVIEENVSLSKLKTYAKELGLDIKKAMPHITSNKGELVLRQGIDIGRSGDTITGETYLKLKDLGWNYKQAGLEQTSIGNRQHPNFRMLINKAGVKRPIILIPPKGIKGGIDISIPGRDKVLSVPKNMANWYTNMVDKAYEKAGEQILRFSRNNAKVDAILNLFVDKFGLSKEFKKLQKNYKLSKHRYTMIANRLRKSIEDIDSTFETARGKVDFLEGKTGEQLEAAKRALKTRQRQIAEGGITAFDEKYQTVRAASKEFMKLEKELRAVGMLQDHQFKELNRKERDFAIRSIRKLEQKIQEVEDSAAPTLAKEKAINKLRKERRDIITRLQIHYKNSGVNYLRHIKDQIEQNDRYLKQLKLDAMSRKWAKRRLNWNIKEDPKTGVIHVKKRKVKGLTNTADMVAKGISQEAHDLHIFELFTKIAKHEEDLGLDAVPNPTVAPWSTDDPKKYEDLNVEYVRIPKKETQFGPLAGRYVEKHIYREMKSEIRDIHPILKKWNQIFASWKAGKTVWNPATVTRNAISNVALAHILGDVNVMKPSNWKELVKSWDEAAKVKSGLIPKDQYAKEILNDTTIYSSSFAQAELGKEGQDYISKAIERLGKLSPTEGMAQLMKDASKLGPYVYDQLEVSMKAVVYKNARENGMSISEAEAMAHHALFDYSSVPEGIRFARNWYSPFITFVYKALPRLAKQATRKPWKLAPYYLLIKGAEELSQRFLGDDDDTLERKKRLLPDYMRRDTIYGENGAFPSHIRMPFTAPDGQEKYMDISFYLPWGSATEMEDGPLSFVPSAMAPSNPVLTLPFEFLANQDLFTGRPITLDTDTNGRKVLKIMEKIYNEVAPAALSLQKADKIRGAVFGDKSVTGQQRYSVADAILDWAVGIKFRNIDYMEQSMWRHNDLQRKASEIKKDIKKRLEKVMFYESNQYNKDRDQAQRDLMEEYADRMQEVKEEFEHRFMKETDR